MSEKSYENKPFDLWRKFQRQDQLARLIQPKPKIISTTLATSTSAPESILREK